jgi:ABC-2 type transport system permease protein
MSGMWAMFAGAFRYEFRMQIRRRAIWITIVALAALFLGVERRFWAFSPEMTLAQIAGRWAIVVNLLLPVAVGALLADRLPRDKRLHSDELLATLPAPLGARLWGKYLGSTLATATPLALVYTAGVVHILTIRRDVRVIPLAVAAFAAIILPGLLFIGAFSVACPAALWVPLYQFLFVGYWFWGNLMVPQLMPTLSGTWLAPVGWNSLFGLFHGDLNAYRTALGDRTAWDAIGSIALLLGSGALAVAAVSQYLRWQEKRQ